MYLGNNYTIVLNSEWPLPLCPLIVTAQPDELNPTMPTTTQWNFEGDAIWTQFVLFCLASAAVPPGPALGELGFYVTQNPVAPQYYQVGNSIITKFQPQGRTFGTIAAVKDFSGNPILISDYMSGRYRASLFMNPSTVTAFLSLYDTQSSSPAPAWISGNPYPMGSLPKCVQCQMLGVAGTPMVPATFTEGSFVSTYTSLQTTDQSTGITILPFQLKAVLNAPSYIDPENNVYEYNLDSGEIAALTGSITDTSPNYAPKTQLRQTDTIFQTGTVT